MKYRPDVDGLRTIAVVPVVLFHTGLGFPGGFIGVDIFFVISGFLISTILWNELRTGDFSIIRFYERRMRRILPALFVVMIVSTILATALFLPDHLADFGKSIIATNLFLSNLYFYSETDYFTEAAHLKPMLHTWSLAVEEQYYILFPLILALLFRVGSARFVLVCMILAAMASLATAIWTVHRNPPGAFYLPHARAWELLLGAITAICLAEGLGKALERKPALIFCLVLSAGVMIAWPLLTYRPETVFPGLSALPPCVGTAILILTGAYQKTFATRLLSISPMVFVGKISYSLYLWHWPALVFAGYITVEPLGLSASLGCVALSFFLAVVSWRYVETPFRKKAGFSRQVIFAASGASLAVMTGIGGTLVASQGLPGRVPDNIAALLQEKRFMHDRRDCHFVTPERAIAGDVCRRGDLNAAPGFVLAGDSHADAFSPAIFTAARSLGLSGYQYTQAGFRPLPLIQKQGDPAYAAQTDAFLTFLKDRPALKTVIITAFWEHQATGATYRHEGDIWFDLAPDDMAEDPDRSTLTRGLGRLAAAFPERRFVLLDDVPSGDALDLKVHARALLFSANKSQLHAGMPTQYYAAQRSLYEPLLKQVANEYPNVSYHPFFASLCDATICPLFNETDPIFRNGDHLSAQGALMLRPRAEDLLQEVISTRSTATSVAE